MTFVAIEGVIGVGKTTLARYLHQEIDASLVLEVFEENPFLKAFYQDRDRYAFQTQIFFLLSRYHQLQELAGVPPPIVSDYMFAKDSLFAHLNIKGDELAMYERVHAALAEYTMQPDLVVYLRADTPTLMHRIAIRDRPYEREMDEDYIDSLRVAYENFFQVYTADRSLIIDTNNLDIIQQEEHRTQVLGRIRSALGEGPQQPSLPGLESASRLVVNTRDPDESRRLGAFQRLHRDLDKDNGFSADLLLNFVQLQEEIGELAGAVKHHWLAKQSGDQRQGSMIRDGLADVLASVLKVANNAGIDLEEAYLQKMAADNGETKQGKAQD